MASADLEQGREAYERRAWREAYDAFLRADADEPLGAEDLELLAVTAYLLALDDRCGEYLERAHERFLEAGDVLRAVRCAFWLGMTLSFRGEAGPGGGWLARAQRLLEREPGETAEHGYLLIPLALRQVAEGEWDAAIATAGRATALAERFDDPDLFALAAHMQGHHQVVHGRVVEGASLLDEAMVAATSRVRSPIVTGIVYCGVVLACVETYDVRRAQQWTEVLARWCGDQPDLVAFTGRCLIHRAEIKQLRGEWSDALDEARRASERLAQGFNRSATAQAFYRQGELHRLRGDVAAAERAYEAASRYGFEPQPGLALLRFAQGRSEAAAASVRRSLLETVDRPRRAALLPAAVEILLAAGEVDEARDACTELERVAEDYGSAYLAAVAEHCRGALLLQQGEAEAALRCVRSAWLRWGELEAPYEAARARTVIALACRSLGDEDSASLELAAAREAFSALGAEPDVARITQLSRTGEVRETYGLTERELEVLRLVASGKSNREIAAALVISEHTVARHLQNLFAKLDVPSRTAASAFAYEHDLV